jgi:hypothetical protein
MGSGLRWVLLRHLPWAQRLMLVDDISRRTPPADTRPTISDEEWLQFVAEAAAQARHFYSPSSRDPQPRSPAEATDKSRRRAYRIAQALASRMTWEGRPLTWISQAEIAAEVGCSERHVRRFLTWLQRLGAMYEVVPPCGALPMMELPEDPTPEERAEYHRRKEAEAAVQARARDAAQAELAALTAGCTGAEAAAAGRQAMEASSEHEAVSDDLDAPRVVRIVPVYELRVPLSEAERAESRAIEAAAKPRLTPAEVYVEEQRDRLVHWRNAHNHRELAVVCPDGHEHVMPSREAAQAVTSGNGIALLRLLKNVHPPVALDKDRLSPSLQPVDKQRRASRGPDQKGSATCANTPDWDSKTGSSTRKPQRRSPAYQAAQIVFDEYLPPKLRHDMTVPWLAGRFEPFVHKRGWTATDMARQILDLIPGGGKYLPQVIDTSKGFIAYRLELAVKQPSPTMLDKIAAHENTRRANRRAAAAQAQLEAIQRERAAVRACDLCDENGMIDVLDGPTARCNHDPETGGW